MMLEGCEATSEVITDRESRKCLMIRKKKGRKEERKKKDKEVLGRLSYVSGALLRVTAALFLQTYSRLCRRNSNSRGTEAQRSPKCIRASRSGAVRFF